jgi:hypothetical protein
MGVPNIRGSAPSEERSTPNDSPKLSQLRAGYTSAVTSVDGAVRCASARRAAHRSTSTCTVAREAADTTAQPITPPIEVFVSAALGGSCPARFLKAAVRMRWVPQMAAIPAARVSRTPPIVGCPAEVLVFLAAWRPIFVADAVSVIQAICPKLRSLNAAAPTFGDRIHHTWDVVWRGDRAASTRRLQSRWSAGD